MAFISLWKSAAPRGYRQGLKEFRQKRWSAASRAFEAAVSQDPAHAPSHFKLGMCRYRLKQYDQAVNSIAHAISLAPERTEWLEQLEQVEQQVRKGAKKTLGQGTRQFSVQSDGEGSDKLSTQLMQMRLLQGDYQQFDTILSLYEHDLGTEELHGSRLAHAACEAQFMRGRAPEFKNQLGLFPSGSVEFYYYRAKALFYRGAAAEAVKELQLCSDLRTLYAEIDYLMAAGLASLGEKVAAKQVLESVAARSRRAMTWTHLARQVGSLSELSHYLEFLDSWVAKQPASRHHRDIASATALAALRGGNGALARKVWHDCVAHHAQRKGGAASVLPATLRFTQLPGMPTWLGGYADLPYDTSIDIGSRARQAVEDVSALTSESERLRWINETAHWLHSTPHSSLRPSYLQMLAQDRAVIDELVGGDTPFQLSDTDNEAAYLTHGNGIGIRVVFLQPEANTVIDHGVEWTLLPSTVVPSTAVPGGSAPSAASDRTPDGKGYGQFETVADKLLHIDKQSIRDPDRLVCHAYENLLYALMVQDMALEAGAVHALQLCNEAEQPYQTVLKGKFVIPTLEMLQTAALDVVLHVSGLENVGYQANMWIPVLEKLNCRCAIVIREKRTAAELIPTSLPVYWIRNLRELEWLGEAGVKTVLYPGNAQKNSQVMRMHRLNHFFINHGESDKVVNQSKFLMAYDKLLVAGPLAERRLRESGLPVRDEQIVHVGRPQVELSLDRVEHPTTTIQTILYAPTWEGFVEEANYSSVNAKGLAMMQQLSQRSDLYIYFKPHPYTGYNKDGDSKRYLQEIEALVERSSNMEYVGFDKNIHYYMNKADLLLTDISSVLNDYLYTLKPIILAGVGRVPEDELLSQYPSSRAAYLLGDRDIDGLLQELGNKDHLKTVRDEVCRDSLGSFKEGSLAQFDNVILSSLVKS